MKLRKWQSECINKALDKYSKGQKHFLALATPGAGKTIMSSELSRRLLQQDKIDFIFCFSPSRIVAYDFSQSLEKSINARFDGLIGAKGCTKTYQAMQYLEHSFWSILNTHRVFVIFDEIHHCAGSTVNNANTWGRAIIERIKNSAEYSVALTGTPWRSDASPVVLSKYCGTTGKIQCDYIYGLKEAINDNVCRIPQVIAMDNSQITLKEKGKTQEFISFSDLLLKSGLPYSRVVQNEIVIEQMLARANFKLEQLRAVNDNSAGLIVASSISHAWKIHSILSKLLGEEAIVVTSDDDKPNEAIRQFRIGKEKWVISVGMISEGTNIPRLQLCCLLTNVTTEIYFRQILGRILRVTDKVNQEAIMFMPAEPMLMEFAKNLAQDIPGTVPVVKVEPTTYSLDLESDDNPIPEEEYNIQDNLLTSDIEFDCSKAFIRPPEMTQMSDKALISCELSDNYEKELGIYGRFKQEILEIRDF